VAEDPLYFEGQYTGSDVVHVSDVPYQSTKCEDLSYKSSDGTAAGVSRSLLWGAAGLAGLALIGWTLMRRRPTK
jgi:hypothetical protein